MGSASPDIESVRVVFAGRVQGVWFRAWTEQQANRHGLYGWVRNRRDGTVEALFSGSVSAVKAVLEDCSEGPPAADVTSVESYPDRPPEHEGFKVLPTS